MHEERVDFFENFIEGIVLDIQRMSTEDGPGLRTTLFIKGCPLKCSWCHNPESIPVWPQVQWQGSNCIGCGNCIDVCPENALTSFSDGIKIDRELCVGCGLCVDECPSTAMELLGKKWEVVDIVNEIIKDRAYFEKSNNGGVTLSGGEVTVQTGFASAVLKALREKGIHTAIDTCGQCSRDSLDALLPYADLVCEYIRDHLHPVELWVRTPIIPGATDREENIAGIGRFIASYADRIATRWELCSFNNLCKDKYARLGLDWEYKDSRLMSAQEMEKLALIACGSGVDSDIVHWSGITGANPEDKSSV